ncbi:MAG: GNAT family N-acetyltransferase [Lachnospiraceae bacterium]|jgi:ribosomal protein S18 acetylase RimI-like enzyme|nr:GNAT family N-acetyltransferase [Lachnospiraceae bacterium]
MTYRNIETREDTQAALELFNGCAASGEILYKPFADAESFEAFFLKRKEEGLKTVALIAADRTAFASGCYMDGEEKGYISFVAVAPDQRRKGIGQEILRALEQGLSSASDERITKFEVIFFNPMNFTWVVPGTDGHDHPNAPGVDVGSMGYLFLKNCGYRDFAYQNSYHIDLSDYQFSKDMERRIASLKEKGIEITYYDGEKHSGLEELMDSFGNPLWKKEVLENAALPGGGDPLLIVNWNGKAMGFTGPLSVQESGRGFFCGIGVHKDCRGNGAGKALFAYLCAGLKDMDARFMTLFTGETNPARNIYEAAGFHIVRTWADMRKELKKEGGKA